MSKTIWVANRVLKGSLLGWVLVLVGCSTGYSVKTYEGAVDEQSIAVLKVPEDLNLVAWDGEPMKAYLLENLAIDYKILPGPHTAIFRYSGVWAAPRKDNTEKGSSADKVESRLLRMDFYASKGEVYEFRYAKPESRRQAKEMSLTFTADLLDGRGQVQASAQPFALNQSTSGSLADAPSATEAVSEKAVGVVSALVEGVQSVVAPADKEAIAAYPKPSSVSGSVEPQKVANTNPNSSSEALRSVEGLPKLEAMKLMWQQANKEEKKAFLRWAFE